MNIPGANQPTEAGPRRSRSDASQLVRNATGSWKSSMKKTIAVIENDADLYLSDVSTVATSCAYSDGLIDVRRV